MRRPGDRGVPTARPPTQGTRPRVSCGVVIGNPVFTADCMVRKAAPATGMRQPVSDRLRDRAMAMTVALKTGMARRMSGDLRSLLSAEARDGVRHVRRLQCRDFLSGQLNVERPHRRLEVLHLRSAHDGGCHGVILEQPG